MSVELTCAVLTDECFGIHVKASRVFEKVVESTNKTRLGRRDVREGRKTQSNHYSLVERVGRTRSPKIRRDHRSCSLFLSRSFPSSDLTEHPHELTEPVPSSQLLSRGQRGSLAGDEHSAFSNHARRWDDLQYQPSDASMASVRMAFYSLHPFSESSRSRSFFSSRR